MLSKHFILGDNREFYVEDDIRDHLGPNTWQDFQEWFAGKPIIMLGGRRYYAENLVSDYLSRMDPIIRGQEDVPPSVL